MSMAEGPLATPLPEARSGAASAAGDEPPSTMPGPVITDVVDDVHARAPAAEPPVWRRIQLGHPLVKLSMVGGMALGLGGAASLGALPAAALPVTTMANVASASPAPPATASAERTEAVPHDVDEDEQPPPRKGPREARPRRTSHAPDAKAGVTTGYRDGEPVRVTLTIIDGKPVEERTAAAFRKMRAAAQRDGVSLVIVSGFRTMERQRELYADYKAGRGHLAAVPGHSNHQSGLALDLAVSAPKVRAWLEAHAGEYGFRRTVPSEPWHWEH